MVAANNNNNGGGAVLVETTQRRPFSDLFTLDSALGYVFECEEYLRSELRINLNKPKEMCKSYYNTRYCQKGSRCPNKHLYKADEKTVVCKHWLRGLCKKGDKCEFLHEYNLKKMPECWFFTKYGECSNPECIYLHIDPNAKIKDCAWYARGFCKHGPQCRHKHVRKVPCQNYLTGFCPLGPECPQGHPKNELPTPEQYGPGGLGGGERSGSAFPQLFNQPTSASSYRPPPPPPGSSSSLGSAPSGLPPPPASSGYRPSPPPSSSSSQQHSFRGISEVTCFKCNEKGHYANACPKRRKVE